MSTPSITQNWSWIFVMSPSLYNSLRTYIFTKIISPAITNAPYTYQNVDYIISCTFATARSSVAVSTTSPDTLILTAPISGQVTSGGSMSSFSGTVTLSVFLDNLFISPCATASLISDDDGATWSNCLHVTAAAFSAPTVTLTQGQSNQAVLQSFFQSGINNYVASSPHSLGEQTAANLPQYFAPTYQSFITLTSDPSDLRVVLLCMVNNVPPPSGDPHSAFESTPLLSVPANSNAVAAFDDYTLYEYVAQQIEGNNVGIAKASVSQNPAILTATFDVSRPHISLTATLQSQIDASYGSNGAFLNTVSASSVFNINFTYYTTVTLLTEDDGQEFEVKNDLTKSSVTVNQDNAWVIGIQALYIFLVGFSPFHGSIYWVIIQTVKNAIINGILKGAQKLEFDKSKATSGKVQFTGVTLNTGVVLSMNISLNSAAQSVRVNSVPLLRQPIDLDDGISQLASVVDLFEAPSGSR